MDEYVHPAVVVRSRAPGGSSPPGTSTWPTCTSMRRRGVCGYARGCRWSGWILLADFPGEVVHAADYRNPGPLAGRRVLVVGTGSTGMEIAHELTGHSQQV